MIFQCTGFSLHRIKGLTIDIIPCGKVPVYIISMLTMLSLLMFIFVGVASKWFTTELAAKRRSDF